VTNVSRADGTTATGRSWIATPTYPRRDRGMDHPGITQQGTTVRRLILTLLAAACAATAIAGCGAPVADANGTASVAVSGLGH
jgi:hypothetical protein